jgi:hypothetical protein
MTQAQILRQDSISGPLNWIIEKARRNKEKKTIEAEKKKRRKKQASLNQTV